MRSLPQVAVVGPGAVGSFFGGMLARAGAEVVLLGRPGKPSPHLAAVARDGLRIDGVEIQETIGVAVADDVERLARAELVLFAVKSGDTEAAARRIAPHLAGNALVVSLQNGVDNVERIEAAGVDALPTVVYVAAAIEEPGAVRHRGRGDLVIGHPSRMDDARRVAAWFEQVGVPCPVSATIAEAQWLKLIINSMANAISALTGAPYRMIHDDEASWRIATSVAREGEAVANALGVEVTLTDAVAQATAVVNAIGDATSSTEQDIARGRPTEIDSLNGYIARRGAELGIPTPTNDALHALVRLKERMLAG